MRPPFSFSRIRFSQDTEVCIAVIDTPHLSSSLGKAMHLVSEVAKKTFSASWSVIHR